MGIFRSRAVKLAAAVVATQACLVSWAWAQTNPYPTQPIVDSITLSLVSGSKSMCNSKDTLAVADKSEVTTNSAMFAIELDAQTQKKYLTVTNSSGGTEVKIGFESQPDGKKLLDADPKIWTSLNLTPAEQQQVIKRYGKLMDVVRSLTNSVIGRPIAQGQSIEMLKGNLCELAIGVPGKPKRSSYKAAGLTLINNRPTLVIEYEAEVQCQLKEANIDFAMKGWTTFDVQSGLPANKYDTGYVFLPGLGKMEMTSVQQCTVTSP